MYYCIFILTDSPPPEIYTLSLHDALPIYGAGRRRPRTPIRSPRRDRPRTGSGSTRSSPVRPPHWSRSRSSGTGRCRSEEHTSELQSLAYLVCRLLLEKKKNKLKVSLYAEF